MSDQPYDSSYFAKYEEYARTPMGAEINETRLALVERHWSGELVDVGIGCGSFIQARGPQTFGYDINPAGLDWLQQRGLVWNPYAKSCDAASLWDVLEHVEDIPRLLSCIRKRLFVSLPIFEGPEHAMRSKHFRPDEHFWYFTNVGFQLFMQRHGWIVAQLSKAETDLGREDIVSYALYRAG